MRERRVPLVLPTAFHCALQDVDCELKDPLQEDPTPICF